MTQFTPMRERPRLHDYKAGDVLVVFGELFSRGYANGIVDEALKAGLKVIYTTVGRRNAEGQLRPLNAEELSEKQQPFINIPLEAGFDLEPSKSGHSPVEQLQGVKLSTWQDKKLDFVQIDESRIAGVESFKKRVQHYLNELEPYIPETSNVIFVHTMAGGMPRAKIVMPAINRVFKGTGERYASSEDFWNSDIGQLCALSFEEVTGNTLKHLIDLSTPLRQRQEAAGQRVSYVAYGYHGTDVLHENKYYWQSYAPYLQGFAKIALEQVAEAAWEKGVKVAVFNSPEILTNSSSIFLGVEVVLYQLLAALKSIGGNSDVVKSITQKCQDKLKPEHSLEEIQELSDSYLNQPAILEKTNFNAWPQHNSPQQMSMMREASDRLIAMHKDEKDLMAAILSEVVFQACGSIMLNESAHIRKPVWWLGHDMIAEQTLENAL